MNAEFQYQQQHQHQQQHPHRQQLHAQRSHGHLLSSSTSPIPSTGSLSVSKSAIMPYSAVAIAAATAAAAAATTDNPQHQQQLQHYSNILQQSAINEHLSINASRNAIPNMPMDTEYTAAPPSQTPSAMYMGGTDNMNDTELNSRSRSNSMTRAPPSPVYTTSSCSSTSSSCSSAESSETKPTLGVNLRVTGQCSQGGRKYMEDYFSVAYQQSEASRELEYAYIGIYDGHGGSEAATFAKEHLMMEIISQDLFWSDADNDVLRAIREGYVATHYAMWREQDKWPKTANGLPSTAGTTATIAFIRREKIYIGHVGDSGIVLGLQHDNENFWRAQQLTTDHKPESVAERTRIHRAGGKVVVKSGVPRVVWNRPRNSGHRGPIRRNTPVDEIPFLAVARSLGDLWSYNATRNEFIVSPDPEVKVVKINPHTFRCLIFGTDGLWNVVTPQEAVNIVYEKEVLNERLLAQRGAAPNDSAGGGNGQWTNPSKGLVDSALRTWSAKKMRADNTSVVTVILYPPNKPVNASSASASACNGVNNYNGNVSPSHGRSPGGIYTFDDCGMSYQEIVEKFLPPEEYRNYNYYDDYSESEDETLMSMYGSEDDTRHFDVAPPARNMSLYWRNVSDKTMMREDGGVSESDVYENAANDAWHWTTSSSSQENAAGAGYATHSAKCHEEEVDDTDEDDMEEECLDDMEDDDDADMEKSTAGAARENSSDEYASYGNDSVYDLSPVASTTTVASSENDEYLSSFAESYNSLLAEQMVQDANSGTSNSNGAAYQSRSGHEILEEQQLYQQQCMSEEEGYSLTKLETRREQQRCSGVQTFKIFQQQQDANMSSSSTEQAYQAALSSAAGNDDANYYWPNRYGASRYQAYHQHQQQQQQHHEQQQQAHTPAIQQKTLELNSLLQQEREEEQQVALEQMQMLRKMETAAAVIAAANSYSCALPEAPAIAKALHNDREAEAHAATTLPASIGVTIEDLPDDEDFDGPFIEEYLEEDAATAHDERTVQSNVVSSSSADSAAVSCSGRSSTPQLRAVSPVRPTVVARLSAKSMPAFATPASAPSQQEQQQQQKASAKVERMAKVESGRGKAQLACGADNSCGAVPKVVRQLSLAERLKRPSPLLAHDASGGKKPAIGVASTRLKMRSSTQPAAAAAAAAASVAKRCSSGAQLHYPNIPNENQRLSATANDAPEPRKRPYGKPVEALSSSAPGAVSTSNASRIFEKRQLRSNSGGAGSNHVDYSKRTLRTRNSLNKDMKAKLLLTSTLKRTSPVAPTHFLRNNNTVTLLVGNNGSGGSSSNLRSRIAQKSRQEQQQPSNPPQQQTSATGFNLRSRQTLAKSTTALSSVGNTACSVSTPILPRLRRNLRSTLSARSLDVKESNTAGASPSAPNFSKSTRLQSAVQQMTVTPPSPKHMNSSAVAVAAATRARSMLAQKNAAAQNAAAQNAAALVAASMSHAAPIVSSENGGKRASLRSSGRTTPNTVLQSLRSRGGGGGGGSGGGGITATNKMKR